MARCPLSVWTVGTAELIAATAATPASRKTRSGQSSLARAVIGHR